MDDFLALQIVDTVLRSRKLLLNTILNIFKGWAITAEQ
jgi:hypothetical protein